MPLKKSAVKRKRTDIFAERFASALKSLRIARDENLEQLAKAVGVNRATQFRYEKGFMTPDTGVMMRYLRLAVVSGLTEEVAVELADVISHRSGISPWAALFSCMLAERENPIRKEFLAAGNRANELLSVE